MLSKNEVPFYLQGTQTANAMYPGINSIQSGAVSGANQGLLSGTVPYGINAVGNAQLAIRNLTDALASSQNQPKYVQDNLKQQLAHAQQALSGAQGASAGSSASSLQQAVSGATNAAGQVDWPRIQRQLGYTNEQMNQLMSQTQQGAVGGAQGTPVNTFTSQTSTGSSASTPGTDESGGILGLNTPYMQSTAARNAAIMGGAPYSQTQGGSSGGGGGAIGTGSTSQSGGSSMGVTGLPPGGLPAGSMPSFTNPQYPTASPFTYQAPQDAPVPPQGGQLQMQQANPADAVNDYLQTPGNQLLGDPSYQRFQHSPGYQYAVDEAMRQVQRSGASRGLLESGSVMGAMTEKAQGLAQQDYGNWWNRQNQLFGDYQNRLAGLAGGNTGMAEANTLGQNLGAGSALMGTNIGSLFGNTGTSGLGGISNTGAAQANYMNQAGANQAQVNSANQSTLLAGAAYGRQF